MRVSALVFLLLICCGCSQNSARQSNGTASNNVSLRGARSEFQTKLVSRTVLREPVAEPPATHFRTVQYDAAAGKLKAYLTADPHDGQKHPAIIWIAGGDCNSIGPVWDDAPESNDQTAGAYRSVGIVMMFPSLRGGNDNPGVAEGFLGEVDDVLAAAEYLSKQEYVNPDRIYLGGHSTGGTLVLLVAECSNRFRAVFSFGPVEDISGYGPDFLPFDLTHPQEVEIRSPLRWLASIETPTFVIEGVLQGNIESLREMAQSSINRNIHFLPVRGATHFSILAPANRLIAERIVRDSGQECNLAFTAEEISSRIAN